MPSKEKSDFTHQQSQLDLWGNKNDSHWKEFKVAREYVRSLKLNDYAGWEELVSKRKLHGTNIPSNPDEVYKNHGWKGWDDWLWTEKPRTADKQSPSSQFDSQPGEDLWSAATNSKWMNFFEAREKALKYEFEYREEWEMFISGKFPKRKPLPDNIPVNPDQVYKHVGWKSWKDWLVHPDQQTEYTEFHKARDFIRSCRIPGKSAWQDYLEENHNLLGEYQMFIPERPHLEYKYTGWISWKNWLGSEIQFRDFLSTRKFIHTLKLKNQQDWISFCRGQLLHKPPKTDNIYSYPEIAYRDNGWQGWDDWLGSAKKDEVRSESSELHEITIECRCKGRIEHCPVCDGKGFYNRKI